MIIILYNPRTQAFHFAPYVFQVRLQFFSHVLISTLNSFTVGNWEPQKNQVLKDQRKNNV